MNRIKRFFKLIFDKLFLINDSGQRIALGIGLGVFSGIIPGTGPAAALTLAYVFRVNRAGALLGSLLTNTWISIVTFILAIKLGSALFGLNWESTQQAWLGFISGKWTELFKLSVFMVVLPVLVGYLLIAFCLGLCAYLLTLMIIKTIKKG